MICSACSAPWTRWARPTAWLPTWRNIDDFVEETGSPPPEVQQRTGQPQKFWWRTEGCKRYPEADCLQILADSGGSNGCTPRAWKFNLQHRLCNRHGLRVTVAHYPTAASKWNPIEHRLFCEIGNNWAGRPLDSFETILKYLRTTRTAAGLRMRAHRVKKVYKTGVKVADAQMRELRITEDSVLPKWNYTIEPIEPM